MADRRPATRTQGTDVMKCLYLTDNKPSRKSAQQFADWLKANHPDCWFTEVNVGKKASPPQNGGRYQGRVDAPASWRDEASTADRQAVLDAARRMLA
jgi:hypothetical protein